MNHRLDALLLDQERLAAEIALLDGRFPHQKRHDGKCIGADLGILEAEFGHEEQPRSDPRVGPDIDLLSLERSQRVIALAGMGDQHLRVFLKDRRDRDHRNFLAHIVERDKGVGTQRERNLAGGEQLGVVDLRPALADDDIELLVLVEPAGHRLIEPAMFGLRPPVGAEFDAFRRASATGDKRGGEQRSENGN